MNPSQLKIAIARNDEIPAFGAWRAGSLKTKQPLILLNLSACFGPWMDEAGQPVEGTLEDRKYAVITVLMHEFGHALQEFFELELTEERLEQITAEWEGRQRPDEAPLAADSEPTLLGDLASRDTSCRLEDSLARSWGATSEPGGEISKAATGIEALVCAEIAERQRLGITKYGQTLAENPAALPVRLRHAFEEALDLALYLRWSMERLEKAGGAR